jgi:hypothetical protein
VYGIQIQIGSGFIGSANPNCKSSPGFQIQIQTPKIHLRFAYHILLAQIYSHGSKSLELLVRIWICRPARPLVFLYTVLRCDYLPGYGIVGNLYGLTVPDPDPEIICMVQHP